MFPAPEAPGSISSRDVIAGRSVRQRLSLQGIPVHEMIQAAALVFDEFEFHFNISTGCPVFNEIILCRALL